VTSMILILWKCGLFFISLFILGAVYYTRQEQNNSYDTRSSKSSDITRNVNRTNETWPKVAWLMTFPNSGTSYTLLLVHTTSNTSFGSNYHKLDIDDLGDNGHNIPIHSSYSDGPYLHEINKETPKKYVITKTHCDGKCTHCKPKKYEQTPQSFEKGCCTGKRTIPAHDGRGYETESFMYDNKLVKKIIHLVRNPFDNMVSRFHLHYNKEISRNNSDWVRAHPKDKEGFSVWCKEMGDQFVSAELEFFGKAFIANSRNVPCYADFYRYVQWHNQAFNLTHHLDVPSLILHYEDYHEEFNGTVSKILEFLELWHVQQPPEFFWNEYPEYYSQTEKESAIRWMKSFSSKGTMNHIMSHYF